MKIIIYSFVMVLSAWGREWAAHEVSLRAQVDKIREKEKKITEIIEEKNKEKDEVKLKGHLHEIQKEHKELEKLYKDLEEEKRHVRFEHPDQGVEVERKYLAYKIRSIEDMESEVGTDGKLGRLKAKVLKKYGGPLSVPTETKSKDSEDPEPLSEKPKVEQETASKKEQKDILKSPVLSK